MAKEPYNPSTRWRCNMWLWNEDVDFIDRIARKNRISRTQAVIEIIREYREACATPVQAVRQDVVQVVKQI